MSRILGAVRYHVAFWLISALLVGMAVALPFAIRSVVDDLMQSADGAIYEIPVAPGAPAVSPYSRIHASAVELDEARLRLTFRVSGHHTCPAGCQHVARVVFFALGTDEAATEGMAPSAAIDLGTTDLVATQQLELPVRGYPNRYPFDTYELLLGIGLARVYPDGRVERLGRDEAAGHLFLTLQDQLPREEIGPPAKLDPDLPRQPDDVYELLVLQQLRMTRPLHEQVLAVLLVVLIAAAAAYAVFMRPLHDLVINCGALVIGVWGIRAILSPGTAYRTVVDLALSVVILFLLGAITVRALQFSHARAGLAGARAEPALAAEHSPEHPSSRCDFPGCTNAIAARCAGCGQAFCPRHVAGGQSPRCDACAAAADASGRA